MDPGTRGPAGDFRRLILWFTAGVLSAHALPALPPPYFSALLLLPGLFRWRYRNTYLALTLGLAFTVLRADIRLADRWPPERHGEDVVVTGAVVSLPESGPIAQRFLFAPDDPALPQRVRVAWYRADDRVKGGECWRFELRMRTPHGSLNPGGFDYEGWLFSQNIGATATVREAQRCGIAQGAVLTRMRQWVADRLEAALPGHPARPLVSALTLGDRSAFSDADWEMYRRTGTTHLVAISGFNVGIIATAAFFLFRWLWSAWPRLCLWLPAQRVGLLASAVLAWAYALLSGFEAPVQRAVVMLLVVLVAAWVHRLTEASRVLLLAWLTVLLLDPFAVLSAGLWLSFGAVAAIFYFTLHRLGPPRLWDTAVKLQLLLAAALAPMTLYFFQGASWAAPLVNLLAVPLFVVLTPAVVAALVLTLLAPMLGTPLLEWLADGMRYLQAVLAWTAELPQLWWSGGLDAAGLALSLIGVVLLFAPRGLPVRRLAVLAFVPLAFPTDRAPRQGFELAALDVGQGLAVVVRTARHTLLYDAGPAYADGFDAGRSVVAPYLLSRGVSRLDLLMVSHGDNDHAGGVASIRKLLAVDAEMGTSGAPPCIDGQRWEWDGVQFEILHPREPAPKQNNNSCVLRVADPAWSVLLAGDIEAAAEQRLLQERRMNLAADVLIAPHHGSHTSSTEEFVSTVAPHLVIHAAGWRNRFRHPRPDVVARYQQAGARQLMTGNSGAVLLRQGEEGLEVSAWREQAARFWNARPGAFPEAPLAVAGASAPDQSVVDFDALP